MIVKWLIDAISYVIGGICSGLAALVPAPPAWVAQGMSQVATVYNKAGLFDNWIPVALAFTIVSWLLAAQLIAVGMRLLRVAISYLSFGGGAVSD